MNTPFANMTFDQLAAIAQESTDALPNHTVVMPFRTLAPQDEPRPQAISVPSPCGISPQARTMPPPPAATSVPSGNRKGRKRTTDTTDIVQLAVIARRCARHFQLDTDENGKVTYQSISKPAGIAIVKYLESLGNSVVRNVNLVADAKGVEVLVFG